MLPTPEQFKERISRRTQTATSTRYKFPYTHEQTRQMLLTAYQAQVAGRAGSLIEDEATLNTIARAAKWLTGDHKPGLLLYGTVGSGKTTLARAVCSMIDTIHASPLESQRRSVRKVTAGQLCEMRTKEEEFNRLKITEMLFIDDLGVEPMTVKSYGNEFTPLVDVLYYRYDRRMFTIITSNLDERGLSENYGVRVADRINEMFDKLSYTHKSYRI